MVDELVDAGVVGADVGFGELPLPIGGGFGGRGEDALGMRSGGGVGKAEFDGYGLERAQLGEEEDGSGRIGLSPILGVDSVDEWQVYVVVVHNE